MPSVYQKNYSDKGYRMKYEKDVSIAPYKNWVMQFKIEMPEILPLIWRRIQVPTDYNFWDLHVAIQDSMGWLDYHLHHFEIRKKNKSKEDHIGIPDLDGPSDMVQEVFPGWEIPISLYFDELGKTAKYLYDYGDSWWHTVQLEGYLFKEKNRKYPVCIAGERACPPEDCGGDHGYYEMLKTLSEPENEGYEDMRTWVGKNWDSERFDKDKVKFFNPHTRWKNAFLKG